MKDLVNVNNKGDESKTIYFINLSGFGKNINENNGNNNNIYNLIYIPKQNKIDNLLLLSFGK